MKRILANLAFAAILLAGCGGGTTAPVFPTSSGQMPPVAILRLFDTTGTDISGHIALVQGKADRIEVRLLAADGVTRITGGVKLAFTFSPSSLAQAAPIDTLIWTVTPTAPPDSSGSLSITVTQPTNSTPIQKFGPFQALVHPGS